ncbi:monovalent cation:proton antiporter-2 (CPA2) family protein [Caulobacter sp. 17J80-11]|uniref:monovalent cation:proton antiporter-2 (CPA2) family protein n=1 Tax=Caulobacter sp. 17J80-11 TaxID=2763502 RepID=UPI001653DD5B|nr:monovalent cation:proton antiporter-2 (CPA2) family protein [Caulobacter sp. 17J80-11]MBC6982550.1 cation:proton antiporter [Caulobacter sp. 17J80-11]
MTVLTQIFVYLAAAVVSGPAAKRLGLGSVLGYLVAGVVIGPHVLKLVGAIEDVRRASEFGVVILLFLIGLELRPALLWNLRRAIFGLGLAQMLAVGAALAAGAVVLGLTGREAIATGLILALSSTAIVLQLLDEKGLRRGPVGLAVFGVLLFQDLAVIPLLAFLPLLAVGGAAAVHDAEAAAHGINLIGDWPAWAQGLAVLGAVLALVVGGRYLTQPVFRYIARAGLREAFTAFALLLVVGAALLMQLVGMSPALGAFLAGVVLAESEFRRELETDIEPFRGLLLGLFFITVGAGLNVPLVLSRPVDLALVVLGVMALKGLVMFGLGLLFRGPWRDAGTAAVALAQGGEFAFVLLSFAVTAHVLGADLAALLTAAVALSMAATPVALTAWEQLARTPARAGAEPVNAFEEETPDALVIGFGRFGQIVGRVLTANGFTTSVLENSVEQIELLRRFGRRVYYGDGARLDLLRAAGAERAKVIVVAVGDKDKATEIVEIARETFPHLKVLARAFDRRHAYELLDKGAHIVERETFEGGLAMAAETLRGLGWRAYRAERAARLFRLHDERMFEQLRPLWGDEERFAIASRESSPRMDDLLRSDLERAVTHTEGESEEEAKGPDPGAFGC